MYSTQTNELEHSLNDQMYKSESLERIQLLIINLIEMLMITQGIIEI